MRQLFSLGYTLLIVPLLVACSTPGVPTSMPVAAWAPHLQTAPLPAALLLRLPHDAPQHQQWQQATAQALIARQQLAAIVLEMADNGHSTQCLPPDATDAKVQQALQWQQAGWPWPAYGPTIMTAVRAGVPVVGGNLPRAAMKTVMQQAVWDSHLPPAAWERQREAIRTGHCHLLPAQQITPMTRIQLAKDAQMARTIQSHRQAGKTVLLIAGRGHVLRSIGVPTWLDRGTPALVAVAQAGAQDELAPTFDADVVVQTPALPAKDHCAALQRQWGKNEKP